MRNTDQWSAIAEMLGNLIAKYADVLNIDSISETNSNSNIKTSEDAKILSQTIESDNNI